MPIAWYARGGGLKFGPFMHQHEAAMKLFKECGDHPPDAYTWPEKFRGIWGYGLHGATCPHCGETARSGDYHQCRKKGE